MEYDHWKKTGYKLKPRLSFSSPPDIHAGVMKLILYGSVAAGVVIKLLPCGGGSFIFKGVPSMFHAFVISIMFAFTGAFSSLLASGKAQLSRYENFSRCYALLFAVLAIAIVVIRSVHQVIQIIEA